MGAGRFARRMGGRKEMKSFMLACGLEVSESLLVPAGSWSIVDNRIYVAVGEMEIFIREFEEQVNGVIYLSE